jgi:2-oxo-4-hydroxy-4-carboxy-5-ureidoimidazoline decarboxylase
MSQLGSKFVSSNCAQDNAKNVNSATRQKIRISELNKMERDEFVRMVGPVFEPSPWIAEIAWERKPFVNVAELHGALCEVVENSEEEKQLGLIRAHPDLVGRAALAGTLTRESTGEQAAAGLNQLSPEEIRLFQEHNAAYKEKFGFPIVICARLNKKEAILLGFERRIKNTKEREVKTALEEIFKIAELRLRDLINE